MVINRFSIRKYKKRDRPAVREITYRTGFKGKDLTNQGYFDDKELWFLMFIDYYCRYEPENFFVIQERDSGEVGGFICGTLDTNAQQSRFWKSMTWRIFLRALLVTSWRYWRSFRNLVAMKGMAGAEDRELKAKINSQYPAHLHINVLPEHHGKGLGTRLIKHFENHLAAYGVRGIHLQTSNYNHKAVPFYKKMGYSIISETTTEHPTLQDFKLLVFTKQLCGDLSPSMN
jgi:ribosomal protein S18 acetylase RimI-like enzyme